MDSDSDYSDEMGSHFSMNNLSYGSKNRTNDSRANESNERSGSSNNATNGTDTADESIIVVRKKKTVQRVLDSDSDSESDSNVSQNKSTNESTKESSSNSLSSQDDSEENRSSEYEEDPDETMNSAKSVQKRNDRVDVSDRKKRGDSNNDPRQSSSLQDELNGTQNSVNSFRSEQNVSVSVFFFFFVVRRRIKETKCRFCIFPFFSKTQTRLYHQRMMKTLMSWKFPKSMLSRHELGAALLVDGR